MSLPLYPATYGVEGRIYRRTAYQHGARFKQLADTHDTPDLFADENDDGPSCAVDFIASERVDVMEEITVVSRDEEGNEEGICSEDSRITRSGKKWVAKIDVPSGLIPRLIGTRGTTRKNIEDSTNCRLIIPRKGQEGPVEISSFFELENVQRCLDRIEMFIEESRRTSRYTHFVAIPCNTEEIVGAFEQMRDAILSSDTMHESLKDATLFMHPMKLHLTIAMCTLLEKNDEIRAKTALEEVANELKETFSAKQPEAEFQGVSIMNDDPSDVHVLYGNIHSENLQLVADLISKKFVDVGLSPKTEEGVSTTDSAVKLHMTLLNSKYQARAHNKRKQKPFDATKIIEEFAEYHFGTVKLDQIAICCLNSPPNADGSYKEFASVNIF